jgi:hypothetical protein
MRVPKQVAVLGMGFPWGISNSWDTFRGAVAKEKEKFFPFSGKNCTIGFHAKWKQFSTFSGLDGRFRSIFQGIPLDWTKLPSAFRLLMDV